MKRTVLILKKMLAFFVGIPLLILGIILIPLPGPGVITTIAALFILSFGFDAAKPHLARFKAIVKPLIDDFKEKLEKLKED
jgi:ABC-type phosphate/phosphonate transport system permease subunit